VIGGADCPQPTHLLPFPARIPAIPAAASTLSTGTAMRGGPNRPYDAPTVRCMTRGRDERPGGQDGWSGGRIAPGSAFGSRDGGSGRTKQEALLWLPSSPGEPSVRPPARLTPKSRRGAALGVSPSTNSSEAPGALRPWDRFVPRQGHHPAPIGGRGLRAALEKDEPPQRGTR